MVRKGKQTPLERQYWEIRNRLDDDIILMFRMGDFYELFYRDAEIGARELNITLTQRALGDSSHPLAGVPIRAADSYIAKLVRKGYRVAIVEQMEPPQKGKKIVKRELVRIITQGTVIEDGILDDDRNNYIVALCRHPSRDEFGLAITDVSAGEFYHALITGDDAVKRVMLELDRLGPTEVLLPRSYEEKLEQFFGVAYEWDAKLVFQDDYWFDPHLGTTKLRDLYNVVTLDGFGLEENSVAAGACAAIVRYLEETLLTDISALPYPTQLPPQQFMILDKTAIRSLELVKNLYEDSIEGTLLGVLNHASTPMGKRLLRKSILNPLLDVKEIQKRLDAVEELVLNPIQKHGIIAALEDVGDLERYSTRLALKRLKPPELVAIRDALKQVPTVVLTLEDSNSKLLQELRETIDPCTDIVELLDKALLDDPSRLLGEGNIIKDGYHERVDHLREIQEKGNEFLQAYQEKERQRTGIPSLKVGFNQVFGYYLEVTKTHLSKVPEHYKRKQSLANAERFITEELQRLGEEILNAEEELKALEEELFKELVEKTAQHVKRIQGTAKKLAYLDLLASFATVAEQNNYVKPEVHDGLDIEIKQGRHPVIEKMIYPEPYVPNDLIMKKGEQHFLIITGPNMVGKSSYLRQNALIILMAQIGCFVPAEYARIGVVDRIFTRIGAFDNLLRGQSTFMLEMQDSANIINNATDRSFILLDEIGRGTSTYDGLSLAWAISEYLYDSAASPRTLLATHFHQLAQLEKTREGVKNFHFKIQLSRGSLKFVRTILPGATDKSFGIHVAMIAGLPREVTDRAEEILRILEGEKQQGKGKNQLPSEMISETREQKGAIQSTLFDFLTDHAREIKRKPKGKASESQTVKSRKDGRPQGKVHSKTKETEPGGSERKQEIEALRKELTSLSKKEREVIATIINLNVNALTPIDALNTLARFKEVLSHE